MAVERGYDNLTDQLRGGAHLMTAFAITTAAVVAAVGFVHTACPCRTWNAVEFHSLIEGMGALVAISAAFLFLFLRRSRADFEYLVWTAAGLLAAGILSLFHAVARPGSGFVWLHSTATLAGGVLFALVVLPDRLARTRFAAWLPWFVSGAAFILGFLTLFRRELFPLMVEGGVFTTAAIVMNAGGGLLFFVAGVWHFRRRLVRGLALDAVLAWMCLLFALAGLAFGLTVIWEWDWWLWHFMRLSAYGILFGLMCVWYHQHLDEQRRVAEDLRETRDFLENLLDHASAPIIVWNSQKEITRFNRAFEHLAGRLAAEVVGQHLTLLFPPEERRESVEKIERTLIGERWESVQINILHRDGARRTVFWNSANILGKDGTLVATIAQGVDMTDFLREQDERKAVQAQIIQLQKMESIGTLAGGVAHDFNNILAAIQMNAEIALAAIEPAHPVRAELGEVLASARRAAKLTRQLLIFSRKQPLKRAVVRLERTVRNLSRMLERLIGADITITIAADYGLWPVEADEAMLEQVIMNLAVNARDAMPRGGRLVFQIRNAFIDEESCRTMAESRTGRFVRFTAEDTGAGMTKEVVARIFEPFFTTKEAGKGTGLGLAVVFGIIKQHGGWINAASEPGRGTTFEVYLPVSDRSTPGESAPPPAGEFPGRGERILMVEDEQSIMKVTVKALRRNGYEVFTAGTAREAIEFFAQEQGAVDILFTDMALPDGTGLEIAGQFRTAKPDLAVLITSGSVDDKLKWSETERGKFRFLDKPYALRDLLQAVWELLQVKSGG